MIARFLLDESSWNSAADANPDELETAVDQLLMRLDTARERNEDVAQYKDFFETPNGNNVRLCDALFAPDCPVEFERDQTERLIRALDQAINFDDSELNEEYDAFFGEQIRFAPGVAWAHARCTQNRQVAVLPLALEGVPHSRVPVTVAGETAELFFVTGESGHVAFFRSAIEKEDADQSMFRHLAESAFPALDWADRVWNGLGDFSRPYRAVRSELVRCLGGLNDHGAACFDTLRSGDQSQLSANLSARIGASTSDENGPTKSHVPSRRDRTRNHRGISKVFWWHIKLQPHVDRIHFLYEQPPENSPPSKRGRIVVGIFTSHCVLPN